MDFLEIYPYKCDDIHQIPKGPFLNSRARSGSLYMLSPVRVSVCLSDSCLSVCNARAPYSGGWNVRQYFYGIWYLIRSSF